jgi:O-antigen/teichoic acid export membrane protein
VKLSVFEKSAKFRSYGFSLVAMLVPAGMQFALFAFYARALGAAQYGLYIALMSWSPICVELAGWGAGEYLLKLTAHSPQAFAAGRGHARAAILVSVPVAVMVFMVMSSAVLGSTVSVWTMAIIGFAECVGLRLLITLEQMAMSLSHWKIANGLRAVQVAPRLVGVIIAFYAFGMRGFEALALAGSLGVLTAALALTIGLRGHFPKAGAVQLDWGGLRQGSWFVGNQLVRASQQNIDRIVLTPLLDPAALAIFGAAQRFIQIGMLPLQAVMRISYPGFFKAGAGGVASSARYGLGVLPMALAAAALGGIGVAAMAQLVPLLIGAEFGLSAQYLLYLAPSLLLFAVNSTFSDILSGAGYLPLRLLLTVCGIGLQAAMYLLMHRGDQIIMANYAGIALSCFLTAAAVGALTLRRQHRALAGQP